MSIDTVIVVILACGYPLAFIGTVFVLLDYMRGLDEAAREERAKLYSYIRTPDQAAVAQQEAAYEDVPAVNPEDDREFWAAKGIDIDRLPDLEAPN